MCPQRNSHARSSCFNYRIDVLSSYATIPLSKNNLQNSICDGHADRHDCTHEGLNIQSCACNQKNENHSTDNGWNCRDDNKWQPHRFEVCGQQQVNHEYCE